MLLTLKSILALCRMKAIIHTVPSPRPRHSRGGAGQALLVFDLTDSDTLERVRLWVTELQTLVGSDIVLTVVANKADLAAARAVPDAESRGVAAAVGASYFEVSALSGGVPVRPGCDK